MKKVTLFAFAAMLALGFASCSKDGANEAVNPNADGAALSFTFDKPIGQYVTYADIATPDEWAVNTLDAYVFLADGTYKGKLAASDYTSSASGHSTTITMTQAWINANAGNTMRFYFVANDAGSTNGAHIPSPFTGNETEFKALVTKALTDSNADGKFDNIHVPLLFTGVSNDIAVTGGKVSETVTIKRRVARFDIVNEIPGRFVINRVLIVDAKKQGYVWADAGAGKSYSDFTYVSMEPVDVAGLTPVMDGTTANYTSVFYLYPTKIDRNTDTELVIMANLDGTGERQWPISSGTVIEANKRYKLLCKPGTTTDDEVVFTVVAADWDEGTTIDVTPANEGFISIIPGSDTRLNYTSGMFLVSENNGGTAEISVRSMYGTHMESITKVVGDGLTYTTELAVSAPVKTITYSFYVIDTYTVTLPVTQNANDGPFRIEVKFTADKSSTRSTTLNVTRMQLKAVPNILSYDAVKGLNLDGVGTPLYFKYGSLVGIDAAAAGGDIFGSEDVVYVPAGYKQTMQQLKDAIDAATGNDKWAVLPYSGENSTVDPALDVLNGTGDPCRLATKGGAGLGTYKSPQSNPYYNGMTYTPVATWGISDGMIGWTIQNQFYPLSGYRDARTGVIQNVGNNGFYWGITRKNGSSAFLSLNYASLSTGSSISSRDRGQLVRCIAQ